MNRKDMKAEVNQLPDCTFCLMEGCQRRAKYDGKTKRGPWAYMCQRHFKSRGIGLGKGLGQRLVVRKRSGENE